MVGGGSSVFIPIILLNFSQKEKDRGKETQEDVTLSQEENPATAQCYTTQNTQTLPAVGLWFWEHVCLKEDNTDVRVTMKMTQSVLDLYVPFCTWKGK